MATVYIVHGRLAFLEAAAMSVIEILRSCLVNLCKSYCLGILEL